RRTRAVRTSCSWRTPRNSTGWLTSSTADVVGRGSSLPIDFFNKIGTFRTSRFVERPLRANICRSTNCHALVVRVDTQTNDVDLAALTHSPTPFVHNLGCRLRCVKCAKVGIHLG